MRVCVLVVDFVRQKRAMGMQKSKKKRFKQQKKKGKSFLNYILFRARYTFVLYVSSFVPYFFRSASAVVHFLLFLLLHIV